MIRSVLFRCFRTLPPSTLDVQQSADQRRAGRNKWLQKQIRVLFNVGVLKAERPKQLGQQLKVFFIPDLGSEIDVLDHSEMFVSHLRSAEVEVTSFYLIRYDASCRGTKNLYP